MDTSNEKIRVLMIDDDKNHFDQVSQHLSSYGFKLHHFTTVESDTEELLYYLAQNPDTKIFIVDLVLKTSQTFDREEGIKIAIEKLWPLDRTAFFVVFSEYIDQPRLPIYNKVEPHWTYVAKQLKESKLTDECLIQLLSVINDCKRYISPRISTPHCDTYTLLNSFSSFTERRRNDTHADRPHDGEIIESMQRSASILNQLADFSIPFAKIGEASQHIGIGVYGSCGRLEKREKSDLEVSIYCDSREYLEIAVALWNRISTFSKVKGWILEGIKKISENKPPILLLSQAQERHGNYFQFVYIGNDLISVDPDKRPDLRNKHWQVLTELRPIFNPTYILKIKKEIISKYFGQTDSRSLILESAYFNDIIKQFNLDTKPNSLDSRDDKGLGRFCKRLLNVLAFRIALINQILYNNPNDKLSTEEAWQEFTDSLSEPGVIKVIRLTNNYFVKTVNKNSNDKKIQMLLDEMASEYIEMTAIFNRSSQNVGDLLKSRGKGLLEKFINVFKSMKERTGLTSGDSRHWIYSVEDLEKLKGNL